MKKYKMLEENLSEMIGNQEFFIKESSALGVWVSFEINTEKGNNPELRSEFKKFIFDQWNKPFKGAFPHFKVCKQVYEGIKGPLEALTTVNSLIIGDVYRKATYEEI